MAQKLWQGAFAGATDDVIAFNSGENILLDAQLARYDILGSMAHVKMLAKQKIINSEEASAIHCALKTILQQHSSGSFTLDVKLEDVHTNVEAAVSKLTAHGKKMHTARSRNDQVLLDTRLCMRDQILSISEAIMALQESFASLAKNDGPMAAYTHTRVAQPITVSFWADAYIQGLGRDIGRLMDAYARVNQNPLGAGAVAGSDWPIDRSYTAKLLAFDSVQSNALDAISSRGECEAECLCALSLLMMRLSSLSEELIWLSQKGLIRIPDSFCTGSSMMPNKRNPDMLENVRGRTAGVYSDLMKVLIVKKGLMSGYHSDLQETKAALMDGFGVSSASVHIFSLLVPQLKFDAKAMRAELDSGYAQATQAADALALAGVPFREAHGMVGRLVGECSKKGIPLSSAEPLPPLSKKQWADATSIERPKLKLKPSADGPWKAAVQREKERIRKAYEQLEA